VEERGGLQVGGLAGQLRRSAPVGKREACVRPPLEQEPYERCVAAPGGAVERRSLADARPVRIGARVEQYPRALEVAAERGRSERSNLSEGRARERLESRPALDEQRGGRRSGGEAREMERREPVGGEGVEPGGILVQDRGEPVDPSERGGFEDVQLRVGRQERLRAVPRALVERLQGRGDLARAFSARRA